MIENILAKNDKAKLSGPPETATAKLVSKLSDFSNFYKFDLSFYFLVFDREFYEFWFLHSNF